MPGANILWSPRVGFNYDIGRRSEDADARRHGRLHRASPSTSGSPTSSATPACCRAALSRHASNQTTSRSRSRPTSTATSRRRHRTAGGELRAERHRQRLPFPQVWRSNIAVDRRLPGGITGTAEFIYNRDVNGIYYINANLPAAQATFTGADTRPRWTAPRNRINNVDRQPGDERDRPEEPGHRPQLEPGVLGVEADVARAQPAHRLQLRRGQEHDRSRAQRRSRRGQQRHARRSEQSRASATRQSSPGHRFFLSASYTKQYFELRRHDDLGCSGRRARWATPATSSRPTRTATAASERPDLHPARHRRR